MEIRRAKSTDASLISSFAEKSFRDTFQKFNSEKDMNEFCAETYSEAVQREEILNKDIETYLIENESQLIGFAQVCWKGKPQLFTAQKPIEINRFYILEQFHGLGVAQGLMEFLLKNAKDKNSDTIWLGVWEHNLRAIAFYKKYGFKEVGDHIFKLGSDLQRDLMLTRLV